MNITNSNRQNTNLLIIEKKNEVYITIECEPDIQREISEFFTFYVPGYKFMPAFRNRMWDGKIRLFNLRNQQLYYGLHEYVQKFCRDRDYTFESSLSTAPLVPYKDVLEFTKNIELEVEPRDYQLQAVTQCINSKRVLLLSPTASGKSLIIYLLTRYFNKRTLIIVPTISLTQQMFSDFQHYGWNAEKYCHIIKQGNEKISNKQVIISTWQSIYKLQKKYFEGFDVVIGDEAHLYKAKSLTKIMEKLKNTKYRFGFTGTLDGSQTHKLVLEGLFGPVFQPVTTKKLIDDKHLADFLIKCITLKYPEDICKRVKDMKYQDEIDFITTYEPRNKFISRVCEAQEGNTLVLFHLIDHGKTIHDLILTRKDKDRKLFFVYGGTDAETREQIRAIAETEDNSIIVASFGTFSTGVNIRNLHNIIFASPSKSKIRNLQSIGRGLRKGEKKEKARLIDISDDLRYKSHINYTLKHFSERVKIYNEEKFDYKLYKMEIK